MNAEQEAEALFVRFVAENREALRPIAGWGDGRCGYMQKILCDALLPGVWDAPAAPRIKAKIPHRLAKAVFERDAYRCIRCGSHVDLTCDHTIPESKGGPTELGNLRTMCRTCNSRKGVGE